MSNARALLMRCLAPAMIACAFASQTASAQIPAVPIPCRMTTGDTLDASFVPAGYGTLLTQDISISITLIGGLQVKAFPINERVIRLLAPDAYKTFCQLRASRQRAIDSIAGRQQKYSLWYVQFYGVEQGEVRFSPREFVIKNVGRDFRPLGVIPMSAGFGDNRVKQNETQQAIYVFDGQLDTNQPLIAQIQGTQSTTDWQAIVNKFEQERAFIRSRAASKSPF